MSRRTTILIAIGLGAAAFILIRVKVSGIEDNLLKEYGDKVRVVVAKDDIPPGASVGADQIEMSDEYPKKFREPTAFTNSADVIGQTVLVGIPKGQKILANELSRTGYLSTRLGPDLRAMTLNLTKEGMVGGLCRAGDRVDLLGVFEVAGGGGAKKVNQARTVVQGVKVLAVAENMEGESIGQGREGEDGLQSVGKGESATMLTIEVTPDEARKLTLASQIGYLNAVLRCRGDRAVEQGWQEKTIGSDGPDFNAQGKVIWPSGQPPPAPGERGMASEVYPQ